MRGINVRSYDYTIDFLGVNMAAEKNYENKIKSLLRNNDAWFVKFFANRMTKTGIPDILACVNGCFVAVEVKAGHGRPSELQKYNVREINDSGGYAIILYPQDWELFEKLVKCLNNDAIYEARTLCMQINERSL